MLSPPNRDLGLLFPVLLVCALLPSWFSRVDAQDLENVVNQKNGSIIQGLIIEQVPGELILIKTMDGNRFRYLMDQILRIAKKPIRNLSTRMRHFRSETAEHPPAASPSLSV